MRRQCECEGLMFGSGCAKQGAYGKCPKSGLEDIFKSGCYEIRKTRVNTIIELFPDYPPYWILII